MSKRFAKNEIVEAIKSGSITEFGKIDLKSSWHRDHGKDISAIANHHFCEGGWIVVGVVDDGKISPNTNKNWAKKEEEKISSNIADFLLPSVAIVDISVEEIGENCVILIEIQNPGEVVYWGDKAYKLIGTTSHSMAPDEIIRLSLKLPGADYSKVEFAGNVKGSLVMDFAQKCVEAGIIEEDELRKLSPQEILSKIHISDRKAAEILFGATPVRIVHYDESGDVLDQKQESGLYSILKDDFIDSLQSWTRKRGTILSGNSISAEEEMPYPIKALRDSLTNAVAHALYSKDQGDILVELHSDRLVISNNCALEAKNFVNKWFSKESQSRNKLLMTTLRAAKISDDLGSGKGRIFRYMIESGKKEPLVEFNSYSNYGRWKITLYNNNDDRNLSKLMERLQTLFPKPDHWRLATALVLWSDKKVSEIENALDEHHKRIMKEIINHKNSPILFFEEQGILLPKRWAKLLVIDGRSSKAFTSTEESNFKKFLGYWAYRLNAEGIVSGPEISEVIGLSNSDSERTQLSRLLKEWQAQGVVEKVKRGKWKFIKLQAFNG